MKKDLSAYGYRDSYIQEVCSRLKYLYGINDGLFLGLAGNGIKKQREIINNIWEGNMKLLLAEIDQETFEEALKNLGPTPKGKLKIDQRAGVAGIKAYGTNRYAETILWRCNVELMVHAYPNLSVLFIDACGAPTRKMKKGPDINWINAVERMVATLQVDHPVGLILNFSNRTPSIKPADAVIDIIDRCNRLGYDVETHTSDRGPYYSNGRGHGVMHLSQHILYPQGEDNVRS